VGCKAKCRNVGIRNTRAHVRMECMRICVHTCMCKYRIGCVINHMCVWNVWNVCVCASIHVCACVSIHVCACASIHVCVNIG